MSAVSDTALLRAALDATTDGGYDPTARSEVYVSEPKVVPDARTPSDPSSVGIYGGGEVVPSEPEFDPGELAGRLSAGPVHQDYTPPPAVVAHRHRP